MCRNCLFFLFSLLLSCGGNPSGTESQRQTISTAPTPAIIASPLAWTPARESLTRAYSQKHYGADRYTIDPQMIVVHYTVIPSLQQTLDYFAPDTIASARGNIKAYSQLNVSAHYVIDSDGSIYQLLADTLMARHIIGYNHVAIGIENIASDSTDLNSAQLNANLSLIRHLKTEHPAIEYLIGHQEYDVPDAPHTKLYKSLDSTYRPYPKPDPGRQFMETLRDSLSRHHIHLKA